MIYLLYVFILIDQHGTMKQQYVETYMSKKECEQARIVIQARKDVSEAKCLPMR